MYKFLLLILLLLPSNGYAQEILKEGYVWDNPFKGNLTIKVNLDTQMLYVYSNNDIIAYSRISSGKSGFDTPKGVFTIKAKYEKHISSIYGSSMPYTQRLTYDGISLHAGNVKSNKASHGCIRLPLEFAKKLFDITKESDIVIISDGLDNIMKGI